MKYFYLERMVDETGMSGTGDVAEGVILPNGIAVMWWLVPPYSVAIYPSINELEKLHSHGKNTTKVVYVDSPYYREGVSIDGSKL